MSKNCLSFVFALCVAVSLQAVSVVAGESEKVACRARPFELDQVRLLDGPFARALDLNKRYLASLDLDRQLHTFRLTAGLPTTAKPLGGWESPDHGGRGEFFGHSLSARAMLYAATGEERWKRQLDYLVAELGKCQDALGTSGYLHAEPESVFDKLEKDFGGVEGIYYTVHKLMAGLLDVHRYCGNAQALRIAEKMAGWVDARSGRLTAEHWQRVLGVEFGGMNEALYNLYGVTHNPRHLEVVRRFDHEKIYGPLAAGCDEMKGLHANTTIPKIIGAARAYELTGDARSRQIAEFFWRQVAEHRCYATGGTSNFELWRTSPDVLAGELSSQTQECCCTYNMLKLTRHLFAWSGDPRAADFYERELFNGVLGTQNPETGLTMYHVPLAGGFFKTFASPLDSFWCCTGTGVESFAKLADSIYFHDDDTLWVNQFIASELCWPEKGLTVRQVTRFPEQAGSTLQIEAKEPVKMEPISVAHRRGRRRSSLAVAGTQNGVLKTSSVPSAVPLTVRVRIPYWATGGATFKLNGKPLETAAKPAGYVDIRRTWQSGDRLEIEMLMSLHLQPMPDDKGVAAIMYGPLVLAGRFGELNQAELNNHDRAPGGQPVAVPKLVAKGQDLTAWIKPVPGKPLEFRTQGQKSDVTLVPLNSIFKQRYAVYWKIHAQ
jgi:uncharacterized protein